MERCELEVKKSNAEIIFAAFSFALFFFVCCHKLLNASLWYDETIEYWYSKIMFGALPYEEASGNIYSTNMYQRIVSTYQPPLYNFVMYFWLKLHDSEYWFRFSGVVFGMIGVIGVFKTVKLLSKNTWAASLSVIFTTFTWCLIYYYQECAEYSLLLTTLFWMLYFFVRLVDEPSVKNIICFTCSAVLPVYSQYGAAFPVAVFLLAALLYVIFKKEKKLTMAVVVAYTVAFVVFALPLIFLFMKPQLYHQHGGSSGFTKIVFEGGFFRDFYKSFLNVFKWNLFQNYATSGVKLILGVIFLLALCCFIFGKSRIFKIMAVANVFVYVPYFFAVKSGLYANTEYGAGFGNRWNLFFIPLWLTMLFALAAETRSVLAAFDDKLAREKHRAAGFQFVFIGVFLSFIFSYAVKNWHQEISANWYKQNARGAVDTWFKNEGFKVPTVISSYGRNAFYYYLLHHGNNSDSLEENLLCVDWSHEVNANKFFEWFNVLGKKPETLYYFESHEAGVRQKYINWFQIMGYTYENVSDDNLLRFRYSPKNDEFLKNAHKARIDVKNFGREDNKVEILNCSDKTNLFSAPSWLIDGSGQGQFITSADEHLEFTFRCVGDGNLKIFLRGVDFYDKSRTRIPMKVDYTKFIVNDELVFDDRKTIWHDNPTVYEKKVSDGEIVTVRVYWEATADEKR